MMFFTRCPIHLLPNDSFKQRELKIDSLITELNEYDMTKLLGTHSSSFDQIEPTKTVVKAYHSGFYCIIDLPL